MAKRRKKRIASRGSVNTTILKTLINGDKYGYEIIKEVEEYSDGKIVLKQPSLYSSLSRFEEKGIVSSYWGDSDIGGRRHYYHLTDIGKKYYKSEVLKIKDDIDEDELINELVDKKEELESKPIANNENIQNSITPVSQDEIPAIVNFELKTDESKLEQLPDHSFKETTPLETLVNDENNKNIINTDPDNRWIELIDRVKKNNILCAESAFKRLHYNRPQKSQKVILDTDGIYKLRDQDYSPTKHNVTKSKIVDNVGKRIASNNIFDSIYGKKNESNVKTELTYEEKLKRNQDFEERFNILTLSKLKPTTPPEPKIVSSPIADKEPEFDYRSKLDILINNKSNIESESFSKENKLEENNLFNYIDESKTNAEDQSLNLEEEDKFISFESEDFETKSDNSKYIEEISNYTTNQESIKINRYENRSTNNNIESKTFVLINKVRCLFGIILFLICSVELIVSLFLFKHYGLIQSSDTKLFIIAFILCTLISFAFIAPILFNSSDHKLNTFKLKYAQVLGILTFFVSLILIYCINALMGFELDNFTYFAVKLIVPAILTFNFVIAPPIYYAIINNKRFYD